MSHWEMDEWERKDREAWEKRNLTARSQRGCVECAVVAGNGACDRCERVFRILGDKHGAEYESALKTLEEDIAKDRMNGNKGDGQ